MLYLEMTRSTIMSYRPACAPAAPTYDRANGSLRRLLTDFSRLEINRRTALLTSAAIAASVLDPMRAFAQETPRKGGVFNVHYGAEQRQLNPSIQASTGVYIIGGKIQENLVDLDGQPVGVLAESWDASPDGKTVTFKPRKGITWHDDFHLGGRRVHRHADVEKDPQLRLEAAAFLDCGRHSRSADSYFPLRATDAAQPVAARIAGPRLYLSQASI